MTLCCQVPKKHLSFKSWITGLNLMTENAQELIQQQHFDAKLRSVKERKVFFKLTSATYQNIQLCETRIPYSKLVRLRSRKRLHQQLVPHMLYGQNNNNRKNQFLKHCIKICWAALQSDYSNFQKEPVAQSWVILHVVYLGNEAFTFLARLILIATMVLVEYDRS